jgi:hypothetical protein
MFWGSGAEGSSIKETLSICGRCQGYRNAIAISLRLHSSQRRERVIEKVGAGDSSMNNAKRVAG